MSGIDETDKEAEAVRKGFRITLDRMKAGIEEEFYFTLDSIRPLTVEPHVMAALRAMTVCVIVMRNGYIVIGKSSPVDLANFNPELGRKFAYEDALRQLWPLYGFAYKEGGLA